MIYMPSAYVLYSWKLSDNYSLKTELEIKLATLRPLCIKVFCVCLSKVESDVIIM